MQEIVLLNKILVLLSKAGVAYMLHQLLITSYKSQDTRYLADTVFNNKADTL